jgi:hypothetical protein
MKLNGKPFNKEKIIFEICVLCKSIMKKLCMVGTFAYSGGEIFLIKVRLIIINVLIMSCPKQRDSKGFTTLWSGQG